MDSMRMFNEGGDRPVVPGTQLDGPNLASEHATFRPALSKDERDRRGKGGRRNPGRRVQDPADLAKRVNDLAATLADITSALTGAPAEPAAKVDLAKTVKRGELREGRGAGGAEENREDCERRERPGGIGICCESSGHS